MKKLFIIVQVVFSAGIAMAQMSGTYTINSGFPTSGSNFNSFSAAVTSLNVAGISTSVTINVVSNTGPYNEQFSLDSINGLSSTKTLTINGNGNLLKYTTTSSSKQVLRINGCPYVTVDSLRIQATSLSDAIGIHVMNGSHNTIVRNCEVDLKGVKSSTSVDVVGIVVNGSDTWSFGNGNTNNVIVENNVIYGGTEGVSYGIKLTGGGFPATYSSGHIARNNTVYDALFRGIQVEYCDSVLISSNDVSRPTITSGNFSGIGIFSGSSRVIVEKNRIHNTHDAVSISTKAYGIHVSNALPTTASKANIVKNNLIYNFNGNGDNYGLYNFSSNNIKFYHNTISFDYTAATAGNTYGYYQMGSLSKTNLINNIFSITRGGSGVKYGLYFSGGSPSIKSNNNVWYLNSSGTGSQYTGYWNSTNYQSLANWQGANSGVFDTNSVNFNPGFISISQSNLRPSSSLVDDIGLPLSLVPFDIINVVRSTTNPDPGAYEIFPPPLDAGISSIDSLFSSCPGSVNVFATLSNFGLDTIKSVTVNWSINGVAQTPISLTTNLGVQQSLAVQLGSITLTSGNSFDILAYSSNPNGQSDTINSNDTSYHYNYRSALNGTYSIGNTGNYINIKAAVDDLIERGICGPVFFTVDSASGPFTDQLNFLPVEATTFSDTIVFEGNNARIKVDLTSTDMYIIKFDGSSHITMRNFNLKASGSNSKEGGGIHLTNGAHHIRIHDFVIDMDSISSNSFKTGVIAAIGDPNASSVAAYCTFENNELISSGVRYGVYLKGLSGVKGCYGNKFINNKITNIYAGGFYLNLTDSTLIHKNDISRIDKLINWTFSGIRLYQDNFNTTISNNKIHNPADWDKTSLYNCIGIDFTSCDAPPGKENMVVNNLIYNFNNRGLHIGINNTSSDGAHYFHNTISLDFQGNTTYNTWAINQRTTVSNVLFKNNLISVQRKSTGYKYIYYFQTSTSGIITDYNALYVDTLNNKAYVGRNGSKNLKTLSDWKSYSGNTGLDSNSAFDDPRFVNPGIADFTPFSCLLNNIGDSLGIEKDIADSLRDINSPDPGAFEFDTDYNRVQAGNDTTVCIEKTFTLKASSGFTRYSWSTGGSNQKESIFALDLGFGDTTIYITAWDSIGCESQDDLVVTVENCVIDAVNEMSSGQDISIFPVPAQDILNIEFTSYSAQTITLAVVDVHGKMVLIDQLSVNEGENRIFLNVDELKTGTYILTIKSGNLNFSRFFLKQ